MVRALEPVAASPLDFHEMLAGLDELPYEGGSFSDEFVERGGQLLQRFAKNPFVLRELIERKGGLDAMRDTFVPPQTFLLGNGQRFGVRLNVWPKPTGAAYADKERLLYAYGLAHNHDFSFLTVGYFGPGYTTDLYVVSPEQTLRPSGSRVDLSDHRFEQLSEGRVLAFDAFTDLHEQHEPADLSISINVIPIIKPSQRYEQALFDTANSRLIEPANNRSGRIVTTIEVAAAFPSDRTENILDQFAAAAVQPRIQEAVGNARSRLSRPLEPGVRAATA